jgi:hypothetical protein
MYYSLIIAASVAAVVPFVNAHGAEHGHVPKIVGYPGANTGLSSLRREMDTRALGSDPMDIGYTLEGRDSPPNCGEGIGSCPAGECCSVTNCKTIDLHGIWVELISLDDRLWYFRCALLRTRLQLQIWSWLPGE